MKCKFCIFLLLILLSSISAQWKYSDGENEFDGKYRTCYVKGHGGEFPYTNPTFYINRFNKSSSINMYFADAGYFGCDNNSINVKFDGDSNIYKATGLSKNKSRDIIFIQNLMGLTKYEFFNKLMESNQFHVRFTNDCFQKDYSFTLKGSNKAIKYILGDLYNDMKLDYNKGISTPMTINGNVFDKPYDISWDGAVRDVLYDPLPIFPKELNKEVHIRIKIIVLPNGMVGDLIPLQIESASLKLETIKTLRTWRFSPLKPTTRQLNQIALITLRYIL